MRILKTPILCGALVALSLAAHGAGMGKDEYKKDVEDLSVQLKADKAACDSLKANAKDVCLEEAKGREKVGLAQLEARYEPSAKHDYELRLAQAKAAYAVAKEKCDDLAGNAKTVCRKEAESAYTKAKAQAKLKEATTENKQKAEEKTSDAKATEQVKDAKARADAADDIRDAQYKAEVAKCDSLAVVAKTRCLADAKTKYEQKRP